MSSKGNYYKLRTKKWFIAKGYACELLEKLQRIYIKGQVIFIKRDVFGSDGLAMNSEEIIFWNSKFGKLNIAKGIKEFHEHPYPTIVKRWVVVWEFRAREPEIVEVE
jgi:hypothetical protein